MKIIVNNFLKYATFLKISYENNLQIKCKVCKIFENKTQSFRFIENNWKIKVCKNVENKTRSLQNICK